MFCESSQPTFGFRLTKVESGMFTVIQIFSVAPAHVPESTEDEVKDDATADDRR